MVYFRPPRRDAALERYRPPPYCTLHAKFPASFIDPVPL